MTVYCQNTGYKSILNKACSLDRGNRSMLNNAAEIHGKIHQQRQLPSKRGSDTISEEHPMRHSRGAAVASLSSLLGEGAIQAVVAN